MKSKYGFPLCIQLVPPENIFHSKEFAETLKLLQEKEFYGVELNIKDFDEVNPLQLKEYLASYNLKMTYIASGIFAKKNELSLSAANEDIRRKTVDAFEEMIAYAEKMECGIICGFIKGGAGDNRAVAVSQMKKSIGELKTRYGNSSVNILLEATNHYEATMLNTLEEAAVFTGSERKNIQILPDTYHMNMEESSMAEAMVRYAAYYNNIHVSDNNRYYPGFGAIDFFQVISILKGMGYQGTMAIEGRNALSLNEDIRKSADYLSSVGDRLKLWGLL